jgi:hypothetical protein
MVMSCFNGRQLSSFHPGQYGIFLTANFYDIAACYANLEQAIVVRCTKGPYTLSVNLLKPTSYVMH